MIRDFEIVVERDGENYYVATVPALRGCHTQAKSLNDLTARVREAIELCLEAEGSPGDVIVAVREALMAQPMLEKDQLKVLMKEALIEVLQENRNLMRALFEEVLEDIAMARAIEEGAGEEMVDRREVFKVLMRGVVQEVLEDAEDLAAIEERQHEPNLAFEDVLSDLRSRGKL